VAIISPRLVSIDEMRTDEFAEISGFGALRELLDLMQSGKLEPEVAFLNASLVRCHLHFCICYAGSFLMDCVDFMVFVAHYSCSWISGAGCVPCPRGSAEGAVVEVEGVTNHKDSAL